MMYDIDELALEDDVRERFLKLSCDEDTQKFIDICFEQSEWLLTQVWHVIAKSLLGMFMTQTSVNGLLGRGRMFVWSEDQAKRLLLSPKGHHQQDDSWVEGDVDLEMRWKSEEMKEEVTNPGSRLVNKEEEELVGFDFSGKPQTSEDLDGKNKDDIDNKACLEGKGEECENKTDKKELERAHEDESQIGEKKAFWAGERLLDLGAGDGHVTQVLAAGAKHVYVTEASPVMRKRLRERGYKVLDTWKWMEEFEGIQYDVITALNLLDRCDTPKTLLKDIHRKLADDGHLVVALVLPFCPYVEIGSADNLPSEHLNIAGSTTEEQVNSLATEVFPNLGFKLEKWSRLPYLCEGDLDQAFYWLSDVVLVLQKDNGIAANITDPNKFINQDNVNIKIEL